eukprot:2459261-Amphidinium_carterae.1
MQAQCESARPSFKFKSQSLVVTSSIGLLATSSQRSGSKYDNWHWNNFKEEELGGGSSLEAA